MFLRTLTCAIATLLAFSVSSRAEPNVRVGDYSLGIQTNAQNRSVRNGYVTLPHGQTYAVVFTNHSRNTTNFRVEIDGTSVGDFQMGPFATVTLERPLRADKLFTFYASDTSEAARVGGNVVPREKKGLIQVTFTPERETLWTQESLGRDQGATTRGFGNRGSGVTGLTGR